VAQRKMVKKSSKSTTILPPYVIKKSTPLGQELDQLAKTLGGVVRTRGFVELAVVTSDAKGRDEVKWSRTVTAGEFFGRMLYE
jgi:hypothetical protein